MDFLDRATPPLAPATARPAPQHPTAPHAAPFPRPAAPLSRAAETPTASTGGIDRTAPPRAPSATLERCRHLGPRRTIAELRQLPRLPPLTAADLDPPIGTCRVYSRRRLRLHAAAVLRLLGIDRRTLRAASPADLLHARLPYAGWSGLARLWSVYPPQDLHRPRHLSTAGDRRIDLPRPDLLALRRSPAARRVPVVEASATARRHLLPLLARCTERPSPLPGDPASPLS